MAPPGSKSLYVLVSLPNLAHRIDWACETPAFRAKIIHFFEQEAIPAQAFPACCSLLISRAAWLLRIWQERSFVYPGILQHAAQITERCLYTLFEGVF